jgi:hypothetical protein
MAISRILRRKWYRLVARLRGRDPDQWWFWTPEWQAGERETDAELAAGLSETYTNADVFLDALDGEH